MPIDFLNEITFPATTSIREVLKSFDKTAIKTEQRGFGMVINESGSCIGVITDGDIRRAIGNGVSITDPVEIVMNKNFYAAKGTDSSHHILRMFDQGIFNIPVLSKEGQPVDLYCLSKYRALDLISNKIIRARVPVRISYSGGGTDMSYYMKDNNASVLSSTITKYCTASILVRADKKIRLISKDLGLVYEADSLEEIEFGDKLDLLKAAVKIMQPKFGFDFGNALRY